jgi:Signal transduction histidine kinase
MTRKSRVTVILVVLLNAINGLSFGQNRDPVERYTDSILKCIHQSAADSQRFEQYLQLSLYWSDLDTARAFEYLTAARHTISNKPSNFQRGLLYLFRANIIFSHDMALAKSLYMSADKLLAKYKTPAAYKYRAKVWNNYGILYQIGDSADRYMDIIIHQAIPYARLAGDSVAVGNGLLNIGSLFANESNFEQADRYYRAAMHTFSKLPGCEESKLTVFVYASKMAIMTRQFSQARIYLDSAALVLQQIPHSNFAAYHYRNEGVYWRHMRQYRKALTILRRAIEYAKRMNDMRILRDVYFEIYAAFRDAGDYRNAKKNLQIANQYYQGATMHDRLLHMREMAVTEYKLGNLDAGFRLMEAYALGKDTLQERNIALKIIELEKKYKSVEKENEILKLQQVNNQQLQTINTNRLWMTMLLAALTVAVIITFFSWKLAKSNSKTLFHKEQLHEQALKALKQQEQLNLYRAVMDVQEEERNRIARDLHDGLGGLLAGVKLRLAMIITKNRAENNALNAPVRAAIDELDNSVNELRRIARNMMPEALLYNGLGPALADLCNYLDAPATAVKFQGIGLKTSYPHDVLIGVYRIVQELLNNAVKHAQASQIIVQCSDGDNHLFLTVEDDGRGFVYEDKTKRGLGLKNIENRVALLKGRIEVESKINQGTTVNIEIPVDYGTDH